MYITTWIIYASLENVMSLPLIYGQNNTSLAIVIKNYNELSDAIFLASLAGQWFMLIPTDSM